MWRRADESWGRAVVGWGRGRKKGGGSGGSGRFGWLGWWVWPALWALGEWWVEIIARVVEYLAGREEGLGVGAASPWCSSSS